MGSVCVGVCVNVCLWACAFACASACVRDVPICIFVPKHFGMGRNGLMHGSVRTGKNSQTWLHVCACASVIDCHVLPGAFISLILSYLICRNI